MEHEARNSFFLRQMAKNDLAIKSMLCRWVSECEPSVAWYGGEVVGLTIAGLEIGQPMLLIIEIQESDYANS